MIGKEHGDGRALVFCLVVGKLLRLNHHLTISAAKFTEYSECDVGNLVGGVAESAP